MAKKEKIEKNDVVDNSQEVSEATLKKEVSKDAKWYVVSSSSNKENKTAELIKQRIRANNLDEFVFEVIVPTQKKIVIKKGKKETVEERFLPGYILIQMVPTEDVVHIIRNTEGVVGFLGMTANSKTLTPLDKSFNVDSILNLSKTTQAPVYSSRFEVNDAVKVVDGPFKDFVGNVQEVNEAKGQVTVLLSVFGRETPVHLDFLQVNKI